MNAGKLKDCGSRNRGYIWMAQLYPSSAGKRANLAESSSLKEIFIPLLSIQLPLVISFRSFHIYDSLRITLMCLLVSGTI